MFVCICERDCQSNDQNIGILDTEILKKMSEDKNCKSQKNAKNWFDAITNIHQYIKETGDNLAIEAEYKNPSRYAPDEARVEKFPVPVEFCAEIFVGSD